MQDAGKKINNNNNNNNNIVLRVSVDVSAVKVERSTAV
jgi:hypothetical protein